MGSGEGPRLAANAVLRIPRTRLERAGTMSLQFLGTAGALLFVLVVMAARPLWDLRHQLWSTLDWRDLTTLGLGVLAVLLPVALLMSALPYVLGSQNIIAKSLAFDERPLLSNHT